MILGGHPKTLMEEDEFPPDFELYQDRLCQYQKRAKPVLFIDRGYGVAPGGGAAPLSFARGCLLFGHFFVVTGCQAALQY
jgi:hypothetical protein